MNLIVLNIIWMCTIVAALLVVRHYNLQPRIPWNIFAIVGGLLALPVIIFVGHAHKDRRHNASC